MSNKVLNINFMGQRKLAAILSVLLVIASIVSLSFRGLNLGLDFLGGTQVEVTYQESANIDAARTALHEKGFKDTTVVYFGNETEVMIRFHGSMEDVALERITTALNAAAPGASIAEVAKQTNGYGGKIVLANAGDVAKFAEDVFPKDLYGDVVIESEKKGETAVYLTTSFSDAMSVSLLNALSAAAGSKVVLNYSESVDSQVGAEMFENAMTGMLVALLIVMAYVALRFQYKFSVGAVAALIHDVIITLGFFSFLHIDFDLTVFAAILAVIGYSLNDTIVVSDRIRENFRKVRQMDSLDLINLSTNQTFARTLVTSLTTLLVLVALFLFGGEIIHGFALALIVGIAVGTYSSIYVSANILLLMHINREDLMVPVKEGAELEELP